MDDFVAVTLTSRACSPTSAWMAMSSVGSPSGVLVAWALTRSMRPASRPAFSSARRAARTAPAPPGRGVVMWWPSAVAP